MTERNLYRRDYSESENEDLDNDEAMEIEPANREEESFKKRYSDLRRYEQQQAAKHKEELQTLRKQLEASSNQNVILPQNLDDLKEWRSQYPKVSGLIDTLVRQEMEKLGKKVDELEKTTHEDKRKLAKERAIHELTKLHPDFYEGKDGRLPIVEQPEFHDWIEEQALKGVTQAREALYENETNANLAAKWISMFKMEVYGSKPQPRKGNSADAAMSTGRTPSNVTPKNNNGTWEFSESQVARMNERDFAKNQEAIDESVRKGKFLFDLSGGSR